ncbi:MAG: hypothetical protein ACTSWY_02675 [Promethearchaeota archaeon]
MKDYEEFFARINYSFSKKPKYEDDEYLGEILTADLIISLNIYENSQSSRIIKEEEFIISIVGLSQSLDFISNVIEQIINLKNEESTKNLTPFISVDGDPEDLGVWFTYSRKGETDLFIQIDFRVSFKEQILIRTTLSHFFSSIMDFMNLSIELIKNINNMPKKYKENLLIRYNDIISALPLE